MTAQQQPATIHETIETQIRIKQQGYTVQGVPVNLGTLARRLIAALEKDWGNLSPSVRDELVSIVALLRVQQERDES
ncbi:hypothetical protein PQR34_47330 [Paraburkholderia sediminicola]|uniref:hypothetical protein n=1 Tax=Paraburkholderia sediminicola TaxID=458836 RepID=UPI0038BDC20A